MLVFLLGAGLFAIALVLHVVMWRIRVSRQEGRALAGFLDNAALFGMGSALGSARGPGTWS